MSCGNKCSDCVCSNGDAMNTITLTPGEMLCLDCGDAHPPAPCVECNNCSRLFATANMYIDADIAWWCDSCFEHRLDDELPSGQMEFGKWINS